ncbi:phosphonate ABC transporter, permease protein PhnE [Roseicella aquatilis]|uniref:Phosphonate ABC transporter, permease protein PhnE n=1 Tax=Roseicella aquatilis TaxID=2527868 RepID=A0A4R4DF54_9PROT|nr:phosphonate ABC transporter, permease protein PhnE [Roseicella aquatilis]TCZ58712.1 phosphonate ABC transporter, permease protein PhnE [Roseicella aquatilis]
MTAALLRAESAWQAARRQRRLATLLGLAVLLACLLAAAWVSEVRPATLAEGLPRVGEYFWKILPTLRWDTLLAGSEAEGSLASWFYRLDSWAWLLFETANMAALATLLGAGAALLLAFPAARNLGAGTLAYQLSRRGLEAMRTVPEIVFALILVWAFGVGPLAGILAIALHTAGALGKLFAEAIENAPRPAWDGARAAGGSWPQACRFAVLPQVAPNLLSYALLRFEINLRSASVIGFVGGGGIGQELYTVIAQNYYEEISAIVVLILIAVAGIDLLSERLRHRVIGAMGSA